MKFDKDAFTKEKLDELLTEIWNRKTPFYPPVQCPKCGAIISCSQIEIDYHKMTCGEK